MKKLVANLVLLASIAAAMPAASAEVLMEGDPANWRVQNYVPNSVVTYITGSPCQYGQLTYPPNATTEDKDRYFAMILTARSTGRRVGIFYESSNCQIQSFYLM